MSADEKLKELRIELPSATRPLGAYVEAVRAGPLVFLSGTLPMEGGIPKFRGRIGSELSIDDGRAAARLAALNALALAREHLGSLDLVTRIVRLTVSVATPPEFVDHPRIADGASELLSSIFGADKAPTRMVYGVSSLPAGASVVVELILSVAGGDSQ